MLEILILVIAIITTFYFKYIKGADIKKYKSIDFSNKEVFLCVNYLYGPLKLKTNRGVISKQNDSFLLEIEDSNGTVEKMVIKKIDISKIDVTIRPSFVTVTAYDPSFASSDNFTGLPNADEKYEKTKIKKAYEIKIILNNNEIICMQCPKNPSFLFE